MSIKVEVINSLYTFLDLAHQLISSVQDLNNDTAVSEEPGVIMERMIIADTQLQENVVRLKEHQLFQKAIIRLQHKIRAREADIMALSIRLMTSERLLEQGLNQVSKNIEAVRQAENGLKNSVHDLVEYSHVIAYTTGLLDSSLFSESITKHAFKVPFPEERVMRITRIYDQYQASDETGSKSSASTAMENNQYENTTSEEPSLINIISMSTLDSHDSIILEDIAQNRQKDSLDHSSNNEASQFVLGFSDDDND